MALAGLFTRATTRLSGLGKQFGGWVKGIAGGAARAIGGAALGIASSLFILAIAPDVAKTIIVPVLTFFLKIAGDILNWVLSPDFNRLPLTHGGIVDIGWTLTREIVNMFFVFWMIIIAFGTILDIEGYGWRKLFVRLIAVALLVNFTQVIAGVIVDMGQILINFLVGSGLQEKGVASLVQNLNIAKLFTTAESYFASAQSAASFNWLQGKIADYAIVALQISFLGMATTLFLQIALLFIARVVMIWILVIMAPVAFVFGIMPFNFSRGLINAWFGQIFAWSFVGVVMMFFMYLASLLAQILNNDLNIALTRAFNPPTDPYNVSILGGSAFIGTGGPIMIFLAVYIFLHIGYSLAEKTGAIGAEFATSTGRQILQYGTGFAKGMIGRTFRFAIDKTRGGIGGLYKYGRDSFIASGMAQNTIDKIEKSRLMSFGVIREGVLKFKESLKAAASETKEFEQRLKNLSSQGIISAYQSFSPSQKTAAEKILIERGDFSKLNLTGEEIKKAYERAKNIGGKLEVNIGMVAPTKIFNETEAIQFVAKNRDSAHLMGASELKNAHIVAALGPQGVRNIIKKGDLEKIENIIKGVNNLDKSPNLDRFARDLKITESMMKDLVKAQKDIINSLDKIEYEEPKKG